LKGTLSKQTLRQPTVGGKNMQHGSPHWLGLVILIQILELCQVKIAIPVLEETFLFCPTGSSGHLKIENKED